MQLLHARRLGSIVIAFLRCDHKEIVPLNKILMFAPIENGCPLFAQLLKGETQSRMLCAAQTKLSAKDTVIHALGFRNPEELTGEVIPCNRRKVGTGGWLYRALTCRRSVVINCRWVIPFFCAADCV
jgi:hypothetical protein